MHPPSRAAPHKTNKETLPMQRRIFHLGGGLVVAFALVSGAQAETASPPPSGGQQAAETRSAAAGAQPAAQALPVYRSPLGDYRPYRVDEPLRAWKDANDEVGRLGGHMGHLTPSAEGGER